MLAGTPETGARSWVVAALDLLFPAHCPVCRTVLDVGRRDPLCGSCWTRLERLSPPWCAACGMPCAPSRGSPAVPAERREAPGEAAIGWDADDEARILVAPGTGHSGTDRCLSCGLHPSVVAWTRAGGRYAGVLREAIHAFKFGGKQALAGPLADLVLEQVGEDLPQDLDALVPVPLAAAREQERGFNQATLLAERLARRLAVPVRARWLRRTRSTQAQADLSAAERRANVRGAFQASRRAAGRHVVVVDDVLTTGATVAECARALHAAGAWRVGVLTVARVV